jgi:hypothetical protein
MRQTARVLQQSGLPVEFQEMRDWDHAYTRFNYRAMQRRMWEFLRPHELPAAPVFQPYEVAKPSRRSGS